MTIYFFGDSCTYGSSLPDCISMDYMDYTDPPPSKFAWPNLVANKLGIPHVNLSFPGVSNLRIHWTIRNMNFNADDIVVVQWSYAERCVILDDGPDSPNNAFSDIGVWCNTKQSDYFFKAHTQTDLGRRSLLIMEHTELLIKSLGIKYAAFANTKPDIKMRSYSEISGYQRDFMVDFALDDLHPGVESHMVWAAYVVKILKNKFNI